MRKKSGCGTGGQCIADGARGFLFTLEAMSSLMLLAVACSLLLSFRLPPSHAGEYFLCSDAAGVLVKSSAFSDAGVLQSRVSELEGLSSLCMEAGTTSAFASSSCAPSSGDRYSFNFPVLSGAGGGIENATVSCWQPGNQAAP